MPPFPAPAGYDATEFTATTSVGTIRRRLLRRPSDGPIVVLLHEAPGLSDSTVEIAERLHGRGFDVILPELLERPGVPTAALQTFVGMARLCIAREMGAFASGQTGAIVEWLRALARAETSGSGKRLAVIGMCFSGGFALGTVVEPGVAAAVLSQPAIPFPIGASRARDLATSDADLARIKADRGAGSCLRVMRYQLDRASPPERFRRVIAAFPEAEAVEVPTDRSGDHSVLRDAARATDGDLVEVFEATIAFLDRHLRPTA